MGLRTQVSSNNTFLSQECGKWVVISHNTLENMAFFFEWPSCTITRYGHVIPHIFISEWVFEQMGDRYR